MKRTKREKILGVVATDRTFGTAQLDGASVWIGKCLHCNRRLVVSRQGDPHGATLEHIVPRSHGGSENPDNLALACERCNHQKGYRIDNRAPGDPKAVAVIARLQERRRQRWRTP